MTSKAGTDKPQLETRIYLGALDEAYVRLYPSGREIQVARGEAVDMDPADAEYLAGHPEWFTEAAAQKAMAEAEKEGS